MSSAGFDGGCLCGAVRYATPGPLENASACHCSQCRRWTGHFLVSASVPAATLRVTGPVRWFASSDHARRGFCPRCGSSLFWQQQGGAQVAVAAGTLDAPTGLRLGHHIFVADKGAYYRIADGLPQQAQS